MKIIDRYIGAQVLFTAMFSVVVLSVVLVLGRIFKDIFDLLVNHDVPVQFFLTFIAYVLPFSLSFTIPWGFLTAILLVFGRLSAENELTALRSNGLSLVRLSFSVFVLALLFCGICLWINVSIAPRAQEKMRTALLDIVTSNPIALFGSDQVINDFPGKKIYVGGRKGQQLKNITVFELDEEDVPIRTIHADLGQIETENLHTMAEGEDPGAKKIYLRLFDARFEQLDKTDLRDLRKMRLGSMEEVPLTISLDELREKSKKGQRLSSMTLEQLQQGLSTMESESEASAALTEMNKRFSYSMACLAFALFAIPFGITAQRRETSIGFAFSLAIALIYFLFIILADTFRHDASAKPHLLVWLPNVLFVTVGLLLFWRQQKK